MHSLALERSGGCIEAALQADDPTTAERVAGASSLRLISLSATFVQTCPRHLGGLAMFEWNVYVNGKYVGTVMEATEEGARCAALHHFDVPPDASVSVSRR